MIGQWALRKMAVHVSLRKLLIPSCTNPHTTNKEVAVTANSCEKLAWKVQITRHEIYAMVLAQYSLTIFWLIIDGVQSHAVSCRSMHINFNLSRISRVEGIVYSNFTKGPGDITTHIIIYILSKTFVPNKLSTDVSLERRASSRSSCSGPWSVESRAVFSSAVLG